MVPNWVIVLAQFPLTPNGKIDRARLPGPQHQATQTSATLEPPAGAIELTIASVWREVLGLATVDRRQNFFDAGGHSIKLAQVHARLQQLLPHVPALVELFQHPTIASLAARLATPEDLAPAPAAPAQSLRPDAQRLAALAQRQRTARRQP